MHCRKDCIIERIATLRRGGIRQHCRTEFPGHTGRRLVRCHNGDAVHAVDSAGGGNGVDEHRENHPFAQLWLEQGR